MPRENSARPNPLAGNFCQLRYVAVGVDVMAEILLTSKMAWSDSPADLGSPSDCDLISRVGYGILIGLP